MVLVVQIMKGSSVAGVAVFGCKRSLRQFATSAQLLKQATLEFRPSGVNLAKSIKLYQVGQPQQLRQIQMVSTADYRLVERDFEGARDKNDVEKAGKRPLVVMLTWLAAQEKHIEKYRQFYFQRGFDCLTVKTDPSAMLFPKYGGARQIARNAVDALQNQLGQYDRVLIHAFSVGGYQLGEMLNKINELPEERKRKLLERIKGVVCDSIVPIEGAQLGIARAASDNVVVYKALEAFMHFWTFLAYPFATKHYWNSHRAVWGNQTLQKPSLFLVAKNDPIGCAVANRKLADTWQRFGGDVTFHAWEKSGHVQHLTRFREEYERLVDGLLAKIDIYPEGSVFRQRQLQAVADLAKASRFNFA